MAALFRIVVDDDDRKDSPGTPYTAKLFNDRGDRLCADGVGSTALEAIIDCLADNGGEGERAMRDPRDLRQLVNQVVMANQVTSLVDP
jgi:hypothetical protein